MTDKTQSEHRIGLFRGIATKASSDRARVAGAATSTDRATRVGATPHVLRLAAEPAFSVPGPIVGAGLPVVVAACGGLIGLARRRRRQIA